jgi:pyridoxamine 5'-phosphate oxidase
MGAQYRRCGLQMDEAEDPLLFFDKWMADAKHSELNDPNAMSLATATRDGRPSVRIVLLKHADARGFTFYTNRESRKGDELLANPHASLCLHWKSRQREVRVEGAISELAAEEVDGYWKRRQRMSQIGAWASQQSRPLANRDELLARTAEMEERFPGEVPRPPYWTGFLLTAESIEFWQECDFRLHDRCLFTADGSGGWSKQRLYP